MVYHSFLYDDISSFWNKINFCCIGLGNLVFRLVRYISVTILVYKYALLLEEKKY